MTVVSEVSTEQALAASLPQSAPQSAVQSSTMSALARDIADNLKRRTGKTPRVAKPHDWLAAAILTVRDEIIERWIESTTATYAAQAKRVYYLSMEFLIGRLLRDALSNVRTNEAMAAALAEHGVALADIEELEPDAALGNGGLGRLAACFMESLATLDIPAYGYGIRYINGMFRQRIDNGWQVELPENWLEHGNPWEFERAESHYLIRTGGHVTRDASGKAHWESDEAVLAVAYDTPVLGYKAKRVNTLRLWNARALDPLALDAFNAGRHAEALAAQVQAESLVRVLYPADFSPAGHELRLRQEYFFSSASLQDIVRRHVQQYGRLDNLAEKVAIQLNDTHPAIAVAELMRLLLDQHGFAFSQAWDITRAVFAYTNHTLLPEALESWPLPLFSRLFPRHIEIIYEINMRVLEEAQAAQLSLEAQARISLIDEHGEKRVRMANLAFMGAHSVNGVAGLHTALMKTTVFADLNALYPTRINNKTNGVTPRRWLHQCNRGLTRLLRETIGEGFLGDANLTPLAAYENDAGFGAQLAAVKLANKQALVEYIKAHMGVQLNPHALFDVQIKRMHEYKRQLLNIIETVAHYQAICANPQADWVPRVKIFAGKAAASYHNAKLIIKLINDVAAVVNADPRIGDKLKIIFMPNYNVSLAEKIIPAADLSEQISTAGMEASGTGNMKFALNGALTIGTLDGANVEIMAAVGQANIFIFGLNAQEVEVARRIGYDPMVALANSPALATALGAIGRGVFSQDDVNRYTQLVETLTTSDYFMLTADFEAYREKQAAVDRRWRSPTQWNAMCVANIAQMGWFSSDRTIRDYAQEIWGV